MRVEEAGGQGKTIPRGGGPWMIKAWMVEVGRSLYLSISLSLARSLARSVGPSGRGLDGQSLDDRSRRGLQPGPIPPYLNPELSTAASLIRV